MSRQLSIEHVSPKTTQLRSALSAQVYCEAIQAYFSILACIQNYRHDARTDSERLQIGHVLQQLNQVRALRTHNPGAIDRIAAEAKHRQAWWQRGWKVAQLVVFDVDY